MKKLKVGKSYINNRGLKVRIIDKLKKEKYYVGIADYDDQLVQLYKKDGTAVYTMGTNYDIQGKWKPI